MFCPSALDYSNAIQNPHLNFQDSELKGGQPVYTTLGLPRPISGNFATVFQMHCEQKVFAVRCFTRELNNQQARYAVIHHHLEKVQLPYMVPFDFIPKGIKIYGIWYPILKMAWVEGELLNHFIVRHLRDAQRLRQLTKRWITLAEQLERAEIAHGDLQHGNIFIVADDFKLVDYDGMFVPALSQQVSRELGHPNYQHPERTRHDFGSHIDRFSTWIIYMSLVALIADPTLWRLANAGDEFLLFNRQDILHPQTSALLTCLATHEHPCLPLLAELLEKLLSLNLPQIPPLTSLAGIVESLLDTRDDVLISRARTRLLNQLSATTVEQLTPEFSSPQTLEEPKTDTGPPAGHYRPSNSTQEEIQWFFEAADQGYADAQYTLGWMFMQGEGLDQDLGQAFHWLRQAARQGHLQAQYHLGNLYIQGQGTAPDPKTAMYWYKKAAEQGHEEARQAQVKLFLKAARQGDLDAQYRLGMLYAKVPETLPQAFQWIHRAAIRGHVTAQFTLGTLYVQGEQVPQNFEQAVKWYGRAARKGHILAMQRYLHYGLLLHQHNFQAAFAWWLGIVALISLPVVLFLIDQKTFSIEHFLSLMGLPTLISGPPSFWIAFRTHHSAWLILLWIGSTLAISIMFIIISVKLFFL